MIADANLESGAVVDAGLELEEEPAVVVDSADEIESRLGIVVWTFDLIKVDRRAAACVEAPRTAALRKLPHELEVECGERDVVAKPDFDIGLEDEPFHDRPGLDVSADIELVGIDAGAGSQPRRDLRRCRRGHEPQGEAQQCTRNVT